MSLDLGSMRQDVYLENPTQTSDGDGGYIEVWSPLDPAYAFAQFTRVPSAKMERLAAGTIATQGARGVKMRYHPGVTEKTRLTWLDRAGRSHVASVVDFEDVEEVGEELFLVVVEVP